MTDYTDTQFDVAIANLKNVICDDYNSWGGHQGKEPYSGWWYPADLVETRGKKYVKLVTPNRSVWGFIVVDRAHPKFKFGDLLKAASFKAPAMNHARGNIFTGYSGVAWTGPTYCQTAAQDENVARAAMVDPIQDMVNV